MEKCIFCGETLNGNKLCPNIEQHFKPMCLNCQFCYGKDKLVCLNEDNRQEAIKKLMNANDTGYEITNITLSPLPLKDATKKCKHYNFNELLFTRVNNVLMAHSASAEGESAVNKQEVTIKV